MPNDFITELKEVIKFTSKRKTVSTADLQIKFLKGYNWANKMMSKMVELNVVKWDEFHVFRDVLIDEKQAEQLLSSDSFLQ